MSQNHSVEEKQRHAATPGPYAGHQEGVNIPTCHLSGASIIHIFMGCADLRTVVSTWGIPWELPEDRAGTPEISGWVLN